MATFVIKQFSNPKAITMKHIKFILAAFLLMAYSGNTQAQFRELGKAIKKDATKQIQNRLGGGSSESQSASTTNQAQQNTNQTQPNTNTQTASHTPTSSTSSNATVASGQVLYVSMTTGSNRNDGLSKETPFKNLQKALDVAEAGATIMVAEGNYYGLLNKGNIILTKPVTIKGGYTTDFSQRDILKHCTTVQPTATSNGTASGQGTIQLKSIVAPNDKVVIDGIIIDRGNSIAYNSRGEGKPEGVESPMMCPIGTQGNGGENFTEKVNTTETAAIYFEGYQGVVNSVNVEVRNCAFINCPNFGILGMIKNGSLTVDNCIFVNVRMAALNVRGADAKEVVPINFSNNTVLFIWSRTRDLGDMGYGYRMIPGTTNTVSNNILGCCVFSGLDRTLIDSDKNRQAKRKESVKNNVFFLNREGDLTLPGGGMMMRISANDFDDVEDLDVVAGNKVLSDPAPFNGKINKAYLEGFLSMKSTTTMSVDYGSAANQFRSAMGMNIQGTGKTTATMFANRYPWKEALQLFGAMSGYGAQMPK